LIWRWNRTSLLVISHRGFLVSRLNGAPRVNWIPISRGLASLRPDPIGNGVTHVEICAGACAVLPSSTRVDQCECDSRATVRVQFKESLELFNRSSDSWRSDSLQNAHFQHPFSKKNHTDC
jgi:hypothetical protein